MQSANFVDFVTNQSDHDLALLIWNKIGKMEPASSTKTAQSCQKVHNSNQTKIDPRPILEFFFSLFFLIFFITTTTTTTMTTMMLYSGRHGCTWWVESAELWNRDYRSYSVDTQVVAASSTQGRQDKRDDQQKPSRLNTTGKKFLLTWISFSFN